MIKKINDKKGILLTMGVLLLLPIVISISFIANSRLSVDGSFALERIDELSGSIEESIERIFHAYYEADVRIDKAGNSTNVTFSDVISRDNNEWGGEFSKKIENFKSFVESNDNNSAINLSLLKDKLLPITIMPHNISYSRFWGVGHVIVNVTPQVINFGSYEILINSSTLQISNTTAQFRNPGSFLFSVTAVDNYGTNIRNQALVDPEDNHQVQVFFINGNKVKITLDNNIIEIWTNTDTEISVETKLSNLQQTSEKIRIELFKGAVNVSLKATGVERFTPITIEEE